MILVKYVLSYCHNNSSLQFNVRLNRLFLSFLKIRIIEENSNNAKGLPDDGGDGETVSLKFQEL